MTPHARNAQWNPRAVTVVEPRMTTRRLILAAATAAAILLPAPAALASCAMDPRPIEAQIAEADIVFVGTVTGLQDNGLTARFAVEEVWRGDVPAVIVVRGGEDAALGAPVSSTSVDRTWTNDTRYLVVPVADGGELRDNACSPTREWSDELAAARPADATTPTGDTSSNRALLVGVGAAAVLAAAGVAVMVVRRRRRAI
jgi:hypothetical protein